jgi:penicillin-binding protein 1A
MNDVLSDPFARTTIFGSRYFGDKRVAIKTGTTNNSRDAWIVGYTPNISVASWMGNNDNSPMVQKASAIIVAPMWKQFMNYAIEQLPDEEFTKPEPTDPDLKPFLRGAWQGPGTAVHSELFWIDKNNPAGDPPSNPGKDGLFANFEFGVNGWAGSRPIQDPMATSTQADQVNTAAKFRISSPGNLSTIERNSRVTITLTNTPPNTSRVDFYINNIAIGISKESPYSYSFIPSQVSGIQDENELRALVTDTQGTTKQDTILFSVI